MCVSQASWGSGCGMVDKEALWSEDPEFFTESATTNAWGDKHHYCNFGREGGDAEKEAKTDNMFRSFRGLFQGRSNFEQGRLLRYSRATTIKFSKISHPQKIIRIKRKTTKVEI